MAESEKLQRALKKLIDLLFADFVGGEQFFQVEVRKSTIHYARRQQLPQPPGIDGSEFPDFFEDHALQWIFEDGRIEQFAYLDARPALDQHRAEKAQGVSLHFKSRVRFFSIHSKALTWAFPVPIPLHNGGGNQKIQESLRKFRASTPCK